jgi:hypothetical protein
MKIHKLRSSFSKIFSPGQTVFSICRSLMMLLLLLLLLQYVTPVTAAERVNDAPEKVCRLDRDVVPKRRSFDRLTVLASML